MKATAERISGRWPEPDRLVWHRPAGPANNEFQAIACSNDEGIVFPAGTRDVPVNLDEPGQSWCVECLSATTKSAS